MAGNPAGSAKRALVCMINTGQPGLMLDDRQAAVAIDELFDDRCALRQPNTASSTGSVCSGPSSAWHGATHTSRAPQTQPLPDSDQPICAPPWPRLMLGSVATEAVSNVLELATDVHRGEARQPAP